MDQVINKEIDWHKQKLNNDLWFLVQLCLMIIANDYSIMGYTYHIAFEHRRFTGCSCTWFWLAKIFYFIFIYFFKYI